MLASWIEDQQRLHVADDELRLNDLVIRFYEAVKQYYHDKQYFLKDLPLRICKQCGQPFLGRIRKQEFCTKRHGDLFHQKQKYWNNKKKGEK
jgi:hypothetical protein